MVDLWVITITDTHGLSSSATARSVLRLTSNMDEGLCCLASGVSEAKIGRSPTKSEILREPSSRLPILLGEGVAHPLTHYTMNYIQLVHVPGVDSATCCLMHVVT
ncbi:hypothetical protein GW17_00024777 [Ensete ventricosum]|nr:hypothetical protein GW17_00024777 [Ensete ventricosum]